MFRKLKEQDQLFSATCDHKHKFEVPEGLSVTEYLLGDPMLWGDDSNRNIGDRTLIPHKENLKESVNLWDEEGNSLLILRDTVLTTESTTSPNIDLWLRRYTFLLTVVSTTIPDVPGRK
jgi:hypothetical protein